MGMQLATYDDVLAELTRRRMDLGDIARRCNASRQYARTTVIQRFAGVIPSPGTKGARILAAIDHALSQPTPTAIAISLGGGTASAMSPSQP